MWQVRYHPYNAAQVEIFYLKAMDASDARSEFVRWYVASGRKKALDMTTDVYVNLLVAGNEILNPERVP